MHVCMQVGMYAQGEHWRVSLLPNTKTLLQHMLQTRGGGLRGLEASQSHALALRHSYSATKAELPIPSHRSTPSQWDTAIYTAIPRMLEQGCPVTLAR